MTHASGKLDASSEAGTLKTTVHRASVSHQESHGANEEARARPGRDVYLLAGIGVLLGCCVGLGASVGRSAG